MGNEALQGYKPTQSIQSIILQWGNGIIPRMNGWLTSQFNGQYCTSVRGWPFYWLAHTNLVDVVRWTKHDRLLYRVTVILSLNSDCEQHDQLSEMFWLNSYPIFRVYSDLYLELSWRNTRLTLFMDTCLSVYVWVYTNKQWPISCLVQTKDGNII